MIFFSFLMLIVKLNSNKVNKRFITPFLNALTVVITSTMNIALLTSCLFILTLTPISEGRNVDMAHTEKQQWTVEPTYYCTVCHEKNGMENGVPRCTKVCVNNLQLCEYTKCMKLYPAKIKCRDPPVNCPGQEK